MSAPDIKGLAPTLHAAQWEYLIARDTNFINEKKLIQLGADGWEMCGCHVTRETEVICYFKRAKRSTCSPIQPESAS